MATLIEFNNNQFQTIQDEEHYKDDLFDLTVGSGTVKPFAIEIYHVIKFDWQCFYFSNTYCNFSSDAKIIAIHLYFAIKISIAHNIHIIYRNQNCNKKSQCNRWCNGFLLLNRNINEKDCIKPLL